MKHVQNLNSAYINRRLHHAKNPWTDKEFSEYYGVESFKEYLTSDHAPFSNRFINEVLDNLRDNENKMKPRKVANDSVTDDSVADDSVADDSVADDSVADDSVANDSVADDSVADDSNMVTFTILNQKLAKATESKAANEREIFNVSHEISIIKEKLSTIDSTLNRLYLQISALRDEAAENIGNMVSLTSQLKELQDNDTVLADLISQLNTAIDEMRTIYILAYGDGSIEFSDNQKRQEIEKVNLFEPQYFSVLPKTITISQIEQLARIINIIKTFPDEKFEIIFDNKSLENIFNKLIMF